MHSKMQISDISPDSKCLLCGDTVVTFTSSYLNTKDHIYLKWAQSYSKSMCDLLHLDFSYHIHFQNADYCKHCLQIVREIDFTLKTLNSLQIRLSNSQREVQSLLQENYEKCKRKGVISNSTNNSENSDTYTSCATYTGSYDYENVIQRICTAILPLVKDDGLDFAKEYAPIGIGCVKRVHVHEKPAPASVKARRNYLGKIGCEMFGLKSESTIFNSTSNKSSTKAKSICKERNQKGDEIRLKSKSHGITVNKKRNRSTKVRDIASEQAKGPADKSEVSISVKPTPTRIKLHCTFEHCSFTCSTEPDLKAHVHGFHEGDTNPYHCHLCPLKYTNNSNLKYHIRQHHTPRDPAESFLSCSYCGKKFKTMEEKEVTGLRRHENLHSTAPLFSCVIPRCKTRQFSSSVDLKTHVALKHEDTVPVSKCLECNLVCANPKSLRKHYKNIHCERNPALKCKECSYIGRVPSDIVLHMTKHSDARNFHCPECKASYKNKCSLGFHIKNVHLKTADKKHKCSQCPMAFSQASILKKHEQSHATTQCYACKKCGARFKHIATLQAHEKHNCKGMSARRIIQRNNSNPIKSTCTSTRNQKRLKTELEKQLESEVEIFDKLMASETALVSLNGESKRSENTAGEESSMAMDHISVDSAVVEDTARLFCPENSVPLNAIGDIDPDLPDYIPSLQAPASGNLENFICSADTGGDYNWINPELFGEDFAALDIFEEAETGSLISAVLPLTGSSSIGVIWD